MAKKGSKDGSKPTHEGDVAAEMQLYQARKKNN